MKKAPTDPEKARPYFYIMRNKEIFAQPQSDGRGISHIYEDQGRLISSAKITGNITDEEILELLKTAEGFKKLVHSIGVSVLCDEPEKKVTFAFQMYGEKDLYGGGNNLISVQPSDGMEHKIILNDIEWADDNKEPGQIRFEYDEPEIKASVSVRFYLNDGFTAPEAGEENEVDTSSALYKNMIERSIISMGNLSRVQRAIKKAKDGKDVTIAFIGGSITQGAGATPINTECYAHKTYSFFKDNFGNGKNVHFVKAGVGGTPSELGMIRFERDILRYGSVDAPDIVVVEFAVNDDNDETKGVCYESLVRKILKLPNKPAVILEFAVFADDWNLEERLTPVGEKLKLPMVSVRQAVVPQFTDAKERVLTKNQFFYDVFHPTNLGHTIMADGLIHFLKKADKALIENGEDEDETDRLLSLSPAIGSTFENVILIDKKDNSDKIKIDCGGFIYTDEALQSVEMDFDITGTAEFPYNYMYDGTKNSDKPYFEAEINARALLIIIKDSGDIDVGRAEAHVDGKHIMTLDPHINNWTHCNPLILFDEPESGLHKIRIEISKDTADKKFTILGFGAVL